MTVVDLFRIGTARAGACLVCAALASSCGVDVKRDTPEAAAESALKIYARRRYSQLDEVADPAGARADARDTACLGVALTSFHRTNWGGYEAGPELKECLCGQQGASSAAKATFATTQTHEAIQEATSPGNCSITSTKVLALGDVGTVLAGWDRTACNELGKTPSFALATVKCGAEDTFGLVLHETSDGWRLYGMDTASRASRGVIRSKPKK